ncbi:Resistin-like alpha [Microtus ochrogaster]|uniref:Resistin-like alpha n=1 Tax=Microtus ochrogaster TaxID=79684 RepID=A0A8J6KYG7_MICOH|nr:Resistin-like alpha [Microtus ochrogaster]
MKTTTCSLLIIISFLQLMVPVNTEETLDSVMKKLKEARSLGKCKLFLMASSPRTLTFNRMKTATCYLLVFISLLQLMVSVNTAETLDSLLEKNFKKLLHCGDDCPFTATKSLSCTSVNARGKLASCPADCPLSDNHVNSSHGDQGPGSKPPPTTEGDVDPVECWHWRDPKPDFSDDTLDVVA